MSSNELNEIKDFYKSDLIGYSEVGKGRLRRVIVYSKLKTNGHGKRICNKTVWGYPDRFEWRNIFTVLSGTIGELPKGIIKC